MALLEIKTVVKTVDIAGKIRSEIKSVFGAKTNSILTPLSTALKTLVKNRIENSPTYQALDIGELMDLFLIERTDIVLNELLNEVLNEVHVTAKNFIASTNITGGFKIEFALPTFNKQSILSTTKLTLNGQPVDWIAALLKDGTVVVDHDPIISKGGVFITQSVIPAQHIGNETDNWITRALNNISADIEDIVKNLIGP